MYNPTNPAISPSLSPSSPTPPAEVVAPVEQFKPVKREIYLNEAGDKIALMLQVSLDSLRGEFHESKVVIPALLKLINLSAKGIVHNIVHSTHRDEQKSKAPKPWYYSIELNSKSLKVSQATNPALLDVKEGDERQKMVEAKIDENGYFSKIEAYPVEGSQKWHIVYVKDQATSNFIMVQASEIKKGGKMYYYGNFESASTAPTADTNMRSRDKISRLIHKFDSLGFPFCVDGEKTLRKYRKIGMDSPNNDALNAINIRREPLIPAR